MMKKAMETGVLRRIYFDYAASTPVDPAVFEFMKPYFSEKYGNPGSLHSFGQEAMAAVDISREIITKAIGADFREIIFTGSATESNNIALRGITRNYTQNYAEVFRVSLREVSVNQRPRLIISAIEHDSVLETARDLERSGEAEVVILPVDPRGMVDLKKLEESLNERTILVSIMHASNEIGTIQPLSKISEIIGDFRESKVKSQKLIVSSGYPLLHTDAAQTFNYLDCNPDALGVDLMTLSAQKMYGPKGVGALYARTINDKQLTVDERRGGNQVSMVNGQLLSPLVTGGSHEFGLRAGTPNVPVIVGFGKAAELFANSRELANSYVTGIRDYFWRELKKICPQAELNGIQKKKPASTLHRDPHSDSFVDSDQFVGSDRLPSIVNIYFPDHLAGDLLIKLDMAGIAAASGSACSARASKPSHVLRALGLPMDRVMRSIRFSFGKNTTKEEINEAIRRIARIVR